MDTSGSLVGPGPMSGLEPEGSARATEALEVNSPRPRGHRFSGGMAGVPLLTVGQAGRTMQAWQGGCRGS